MTALCTPSAEVLRLSGVLRFAAVAVKQTGQNKQRRDKNQEAHKDTGEAVYPVTVIH